MSQHDQQGVGIKNPRYNPRYVIFAKVHGRTVEEQLVADSRLWPGGKMAGFTLWMRVQWRTWFDNREPPFPDSEWEYRGAFIDEFDLWLERELAAGRLPRLPEDPIIQPEPGSCIPGSDPGTR